MFYRVTVDNVGTLYFGSQILIDLIKKSNAYQYGRFGLLIYSTERPKTKSCSLLYSNKLYTSECGWFESLKKQATYEKNQVTAFL